MAVSREVVFAKEVVKSGLIQTLVNFAVKATYDPVLQPLGIDALAGLATTQT
jgi:hypothetical protein